MMLKKDYYYYAVQCKGETFYYNNINDITNCDILKQCGYDNLRRFQIYNIINNKYSGRFNSKWRDIKIHRLKTPIPKEDLYDIIAEQQMEDNAEQYLNP